MSELKVGDNVFYKGDEGIIREVMMDGKESFYRVDVSKKSIHYLYEDELDLVTQKLNDNQKVVLEWMKENECETNDPLESISDLFLNGTPSKYFPDLPLSCLEAAYQSLNNQQKIELVSEYLKQYSEQEE
ncbi:hypothetical protein [Enterococcus mundtii]|uniref:hypothetical protein n=1 Tax=Enterococcus TaxID=1350 RepID=UPI0003C5442C|nr:hypothetical protein [Enterococcus mundtii]MCA6773585.1 hypothetical protein [Enterococcus mundtii]BAO07836.1 hypothetical protein EMQU_2279 [Enterococcus mundtii QU 25]